MTKTPRIAPRRLSLLIWAELVLLGTIWGGSFVANSLALQGFGFLPTVALRLGGACVVLWAFVWWRGLAMPRGAGIWGAFAVMGFLNNALPFSLITWGQAQGVPAGLAAIINASTALFGVLIAAMVFPDERLGLRRLLGVGVGFLGVTVAIGIGTLAAFTPASAGQMACLAAALSYGLSGAWARARLSHLPPQVAAAGMLTASAAMTLPFALWSGLPGAAPPLQAWAAVAYLALVSTALAYLMLYRLIAAAGAGNASLTTLVAAPMAVTLGGLILGEGLGFRALAGFGLIALGLILLDGRMLRHFSRAAGRKPG